MLTARAEYELTGSILRRVVALLAVYAAALETAPLVLVVATRKTAGLSNTRH